MHLRSMAKPFPFVLCLILMGCLPVQSPQLSFQALEQPMRYGWQDNRLQLEFSHAVPRQFEWYLKNLSGQKLTIDQQSIALTFGEEATAYTLWGKPRSQSINWPVIELEPGKFIRLTYPVQYNSPLYPFPRDKEVRLAFTADFGGLAQEYHLKFEAEEKEEGPETDKQKLIRELKEQGNRRQ